MDAVVSNPLSVSEVEARASLAAAASVAARAVAAELEEKMDATDVSQTEESTAPEIVTKAEPENSTVSEQGGHGEFMNVQPHPPLFVVEP